jgi:hypothetical protein
MRDCGSETGALGLRLGNEERLAKTGTGVRDTETRDQNNEAETRTDCSACDRRRSIIPAPKADPTAPKSSNRNRPLPQKTV